MANEIVGTDAQSRRAAALPYLFAKHAGYAQGAGTLANMTAANMSAFPAASPSPSFF